MKRREFITLLAGAAAWSIAAHAQRPDRVRRIGVLLARSADDTTSPTRVAAFPQALPLLGWTVGRNVRIDYRWATNDADPVALRDGVGRTRARRHPGPWRHGRPFTTGDPHRADRVPNLVDPVGAGFVASLARPGGNATGFLRSNSA